MTQALNSPATRARELRALADAVRSIKAKSALILWDSNEDGFEIHGIPVEVCSTAEWLLSR